MRRLDRWSAGFLLLLGAGAAVEAGRFGVGEPGRPGEGFFPFYLALALALVSVALLLRSPRTRSDAGAAEPARRWRVAVILLGLLLYALVLEAAGFVLATFFLMLFLLRAGEPLRWPAAVGSSVATALLAYALFKFGLQLRLPPGPWGL